MNAKEQWMGRRVEFTTERGKKMEGVVEGVGRFGRFATVAVYDDVVLPSIPTRYRVAVPDLRPRL